METSGMDTEEPEPADAAEESDSEEDAAPAEPNAALEGDDAEPEGEIRSFSDLAKHLEIEEEALAKHLVVQGRDGKEISLHEVLTAHRAPGPDPAEAERSRTRLAELEARDADAVRAAEELRRSALSLAQRMKAQEPDWAALKASNPAAFAAARLEWMEHERQLERASMQFEAQRQQMAAQERQKVEEFRRGEARKLQAAVPAWADPKVFEADLGKVEKYLVTQGIKAEEMANLSDSRDWLIARKAMLYDEIQAKKPALLEKVKALPRVMAPGSSSGADRGASARARVADAEGLARLKSSGKVEDAAALISRRLAGTSRRVAGRTLASGRRS